MENAILLKTTLLKTIEKKNQKKNQGKIVSYHAFQNKLFIMKLAV